MRRFASLAVGLLATTGLVSPGAAQERGPVQACQFLQVDAKTVPAWADSLVLVRRERGTVPGTDPVIVILTLTLRNECARTVYFDGVSPAIPALWTPVQDESTWRLLSLSCLSGRRAHTLAPESELRFSYSTSEAEADELVVGLILSVDGEEGWAVATPSGGDPTLRLAAAHPSATDRLQAKP